MNNQDDILNENDHLHREVHKLEALLAEREHKLAKINHLLAILRRRSLVDGGISTDPSQSRYTRGRCSAFREAAEMLHSTLEEPS
jgi:hypothetical protein